jgi:hypothetical protein
VSAVSRVLPRISGLWFRNFLKVGWLCFPNHLITSCVICAESTTEGGELKIKKLMFSSPLIALGGLVFVVLAVGFEIHCFKPSRGRWIYKGDKKSVARLPSEGM